MSTNQIENSPHARGRSDMGFMEHLRELRRRIIICLIAVAAASCVGFFFSTPVFNLLCRPYFASFPHDSLIGTGPQEAFMLRIEVAMFTGIILASPILFHQVWMFIAPGLFEHEIKLFIPFVFVSCFLFLTGLWFCYSLILPFALQFFHDQYSAIGVKPEIRMTEHLSFMIKMTVGFGFLFEMPVLAYFLGRLGIIDHHFLLRYTRHATVMMFLIGAILTPDVFTQLIMAAPLMGLYGLSILIVKYTGQAAPPQNPS